MTLDNSKRSKCSLTSQSWFCLILNIAKGKHVTMRLALPMMPDCCTLPLPYEIMENWFTLFPLVICAVKRNFFLNKTKKIPDFKTEAEERAFWESHDSSDYVDWSRAQSTSFPNLKPPTKTISLRLPEALLNRIKIEANKRDMPYQSLIKIWLANDVEKNRGSWWSCVSRDVAHSFSL